MIVRGAQNIDLNRVSRTTSDNLADQQWSAEQTLGITELESEVSFEIRIRSLLFYLLNNNMSRKTITKFVLFSEIKESDRENIFLPKKKKKKKKSRGASR